MDTFYVFLLQESRMKKNENISESPLKQQTQSRNAMKCPASRIVNHLNFS